jgi:2-methylcitrate dehydratase PrpD
MNQTITSRLADFVCDFDLRRAPSDVIARAKMFVLDFFGVALTGVAEQSSVVLRDTVLSFGGNPTCTVIGTNRRTNPAFASLLNGCMGHAVEMDDDHRTASVHVGTVVIPAALAAAELAGASGRFTLEGVICGYEVMTRIGDAFLGTQYQEGFHPTGTCGVFGAAAAAARILRLTPKQLVAAFGVAGTQAAGLEEWKADGSWIKRLHPGKSAEAGILAVLLARSGFTGPATILEGTFGFLNAFSFERRWDAAKITDGLGSEYRGHGTSFKPYAGCRFYHQAIDATLSLLKEHQIGLNDIQDIEARVYQTAYMTLCQPEDRKLRPRTSVDAQFSLPYAIATTVVNGAPMPSHFSDHAIRNPVTLDLCSRVRTTPDARFEAMYPNRFPTEIVMRLRNGKNVSAYRDLPSGDPENEMYKGNNLFETEIETKFHSLLALLPHFENRRERIAELTKHLEQQAEIVSLMSQLVPLVNT